LIIRIITRKTSSSFKPVQSFLVFSSTVFDSDMSVLFEPIYLD
jgi:hypothetical protein